MALPRRCEQLSFYFPLFKRSELNARDVWKNAKEQHPRGGERKKKRSEIRSTSRERVSFDLCCCCCCFLPCLSRCHCHHTAKERKITFISQCIRRRNARTFSARKISRIDNATGVFYKVFCDIYGIFSNPQAQNLVLQGAKTAAATAGRRYLCRHFIFPERKTTFGRSVERKGKCKSRREKPPLAFGI